MREREFIGFDEIADACATKLGDLVFDRNRRAGALGKLREHFKNGGFDVAGKSVVVARANKGKYDDPTWAWSDFDASAGRGREIQDFLDRLTEDQEIPRADALRWFQVHRLPLPVAWFSEVEIMNEAVPSQPAPLDHGIPPSRPKPTRAEVTKWQRDRVENWPDDKRAPTEADEWLAARAKFGDGLVRDEYREIRRQVVPKEWQTSGPRRRWGEVKPAIAEAAERPAKLRTQH